jgi:hypothetical protein
VYGGVKCLDASTEHLGGLGDGGHIVDREASLSDHLGCAAGGQQSHAAVIEAFGEVEETCLVVDGQNRWKTSISSLISGSCSGNYQSFGQPFCRNLDGERS